MKVLIAGPNLDDQSKGGFQIHKPGCQHLKKIGGYQDRIFEASDRESVIWEIYGEMIAEDPDNPSHYEQFKYDVFFSPCCGL